MSIAFWCLFAGALLHFITKMPLAKAQNDCGGYDNHHPRAQQAALSGWGGRALAAHANQTEAFPLFAAGVIVASVGGAAQGYTDLLAAVWVASRLLYLWLYLADRSTTRSIVWVLGYTASMLLLCGPAVSA